MAATGTASTGRMCRGYRRALPAFINAAMAWMASFLKVCCHCAVHLAVPALPMRPEPVHSRSLHPARHRHSVDPSTDLRPLQQTLRRRTCSVLPSWRETQRCLNPTCPPMPAIGRPCAFDGMTIAPSQRRDDLSACNTHHHPMEIRQCATDGFPHIGFTKRKQRQWSNLALGLCRHGPSRCCRRAVCSTWPITTAVPGAVRLSAWDARDALDVMPDW